ncbi:MAG: ferredoxin-NADP reductase [Xanthomonadales bacterium]|nr:ferredoxin-NADP reductase [Xanthomonadales bacterium]NIN60045.1 ferredoxin-NADP reductase [Xanthomonadales bacterium]NIN75413.1 ferredoxin-NADP reductase [Xanthomonadales bacterium]NIO14236.1 ferredoxin-NADP reductase [Xanthomonadales bacterium]NIP12438.1 ferredoxin-NADP reductase [Xanthomonadales bacterium]
MMRLQDYPTEPRYTATVLSTEALTEDGADVEVRELVMAVDEHDFNFEIGQSIGVLVEGAEEFGHPIHHRLYTVADLPSPSQDGRPEITIVVRRCSYLDDYSGEEYVGVNSNYLCDRKTGDRVTITGPFGMPFKVPDDRTANLLLIGLGTGIAPFRALVKHIYRDVRDWQGKVRLLYGAHTGLELLYMNDRRDDFSNYYDEETFEAFKALSPRPNWADPIAWDYAIEDRIGEIRDMLDDDHTYVYVAGQRRIRDELDRLFGDLYGKAVWEEKKAALRNEGRWVELLY